MPTPDEDSPAFVHGDIADKPIPVPNASNIRDSAAVENAPAVIADQVTPDECSSVLTEVSG
jgi:hypothetical protein